MSGILATKSQKDFLKSLMAQLGYDEQDLEIDLERLTVRQASKLIDDLKNELEG